MTGVDSLIESGIADQNRLGVRCRSYSGISGGWRITQTRRFLVASPGAMVTDWTSEFGTGLSDNGRLWYLGATPWENREGHREKSPCTHAEIVATPVVLFHRMRDATDTESQSMLFTSALKDLENRVRYIRLQREPCAFGDPRPNRTRGIDELRWMQKYVLSLDWTPWPEASVEEAKDSRDSEEREGKGEG